MRINKIHKKKSKLYPALIQKNEYRSLNFQKLYEEYLRYLQFELKANQKELSRFRGVIFRYILPAFKDDLVDQTRRRMSDSEIIACYEYLAKFPSNEIKNLSKIYKKSIASSKYKISKSNERGYKAALDHFVQWLDENDYVKLPAKIDITQNLFDSLRVTDDNICKLKSTSRIAAVYSVYQIYKKFDLNLSLYNEQIEEYRAWLKTKLKNKKTGEQHIENIHRICGWLYLHNYQTETIVDLKKVIPTITAEKDSEDFDTYEKLLLYKDSLKRKSLKSAIDFGDKLDAMFDERNASPSYCMRMCEAIISYAKYVYRFETDSSMYQRYEDIGFISFIKQKRMKLNAENKKAPRVINLEKRMISWEDVKYVCEVLRHEANAKKSKYHKLDGTRKAHHYLRFLLTAFFVVIPPLRQRSIRELRFDLSLKYEKENINSNHRTLKYGLFSRGEFVPSINLDNPSQAKWLIDLRPKDYKTGETYGRWIKEIPNIVYSDGRFFYDYIDEWLFNGHTKEDGSKCGYRDLFEPVKSKLYSREEEYDWFFVSHYKSNMGQALESSSVTGRIKSYFYNRTGSDVTPHTLRHIFRTEVSRHGLSQQEEEAISFLLQHSSDIGKEIYLHRTNDEIVRPGIDLIQRLDLNTF